MWPRRSVEDAHPDSQRADAAIIDRERRTPPSGESDALPNTRAFLGSWNANCIYLADDLANRLQIRGGCWSVDHVVAALWSSEVVHSLRLRTETFRSARPDAPDVFAAWWVGAPPAPGSRTSLVVFDRLAGQRSRRRRWIGLDEVRSADPRYRGFALALAAETSDVGSVNGSRSPWRSSAGGPGQGPWRA